MTCGHCFVVVDYPQSAEGTTAPCPHCGKQISLYHSRPPNRSEGKIKPKHPVSQDLKASNFSPIKNVNYYERLRQFHMPPRPDFSDSPWLKPPPSFPAIKNSNQLKVSGGLEQRTEQNDNSKAGLPIEYIGGISAMLFVGGIVATVYYFLFYPVANPGEEYVNLERLNNRQDGIIIGVGACVVGLIIFLVCMFLSVLNYAARDNKK